MPKRNIKLFITSLIVAGVGIGVYFATRGMAEPAISLFAVEVGGAGIAGAIVSLIK